MILYGHRDQAPQIAADDFSRRFHFARQTSCGYSVLGHRVRRNPTAYDMVWEFKQLLFFSQRRFSRKRSLTFRTQRSARSSRRY